MNDKLGMDLTLCQRIIIFFKRPCVVSFVGLFRGFYVNVDDILRRLIENMSAENKTANSKLIVRSISKEVKPASCYIKIPTQEQTKEKVKNKIRCVNAEQFQQRKDSALKKHCPVTHAVLECDLILLQDLIEEEGLLILSRDPSIESIFHLAVATGFVELVQYLINNTNIRNPIDNHGYSLLHVAVENNDLEMVKYLLEINEFAMLDVNKDGNTVLHLAVNSGSFEILEYLLSVNCYCVSIVNNDKLNPYDMAIENNDTQMIKCLSEYFI